MGVTTKNTPCPGSVMRADEVTACPTDILGCFPDHTEVAYNFHSRIGTKGRIAYARIGNNKQHRFLQLMLF